MSKLLFRLKNTDKGFAAALVLFAIVLFAIKVIAAPLCAFVVPLCAIHHNQIHTTLKEEEWWQERNIDPLKVAGELWRKRRERLPVGGKVRLSRELDQPRGSI
jgi:hypothetical protein